MSSRLDRVARSVLNFTNYRSVRVPTSQGEIHAFRRECSGDLPPLVLFHGFSSAAVHWTPLLPFLRPHVQSLLLVDLPGHGFSDVPPGGLDHDSIRAGLAEAMAELHVEPSVVIGNSLGGLAALRYVLARPENALGLVMLSPAGAPWSDAAFDELKTRFTIDTHAEALAFLDRLLVKPNPFTRHILAHGIRSRMANPVLREMLLEADVSRMLSPGEVGGLVTPALMVWGTEERILPDSDREFFEAHLPGHVEWHRPVAGHSPQLDDPRATAERILAFARSVQVA